MFNPLPTKTKSRSLLFIVALLSWPLSSIAQEDYKTLKAKIAEYEKAGNYSAAIPIAEKAMKQVEVEYGKTNYRYVAALTKLGEVYQGGELLDKAEKIFIEVVALDKAKYGETEMVYAESISHLGYVLMIQGKYEQSLPYFVKAMEIKKANLGASSIYAGGLNNVASVNFKLGKYDEAEKQFTEALTIYHDVETDISQEHANAKNGLGCLYDIIGRYDDSEALLRSAVEWRKKLSGESSLDYAEPLRNLAGVYKNMGRYTESEQAHLEAMTIVKSHGEKTLTYSNSLYNLALLYHAKGDFRQAENMLKESLNITKTILGDNHSNYATGLNGLGNLYAEIGLYTEAELAYKRQIEIIKSQLGEAHPNYAVALANLATLYYQMGRYQQAESLYTQSLDLDQKHFGVDHIETANTLYYMAILYRDISKFKMSVEYFVKALEIQLKNLGPKHPDYIKSMIGLGDTYLKVGNRKAAIALYNESMPYFETPDGQASSNYTTFVNNLAVLHKLTGNFKESERFFQIVLQIQAARWGETASDYLRTVSNLSDLYISQGQFNKAEPLIKKVIASHLKDLQVNFPSMSEKEKSQFYNTVSFQFDFFNSFAVLPDQNPLLLGDMYNNQLATKGMLINGTMQLKNQILKSKDAPLIDLYKNWIKKKEQMARIKNMSVDERLKRNINLETLENEANEMERTLSSKSEKFKSTARHTLYTWQDVQSKLKKDEAAVEIIRFKKYNHKLTAFTDTVFFAALIVKPETQKNPTLVLLKNGKDLEKRYLKYYRTIVEHKSDIKDEYSYPQFWQAIGEQLTGTKKVYLSVDGFYNQINLNTLVNPKTGKSLIDEIDIQILTNTSDLLQEKSNRNQKGKKLTASLIGFPNYNMNQAELHTEVKKLGITPGELDELRTIDVRFSASLGTVPELPATKVEVEGIQKILSAEKWEVKTLMSNLALEESVKLLQGPSLFHVATQGFFEPDADTEANNKNLKYENALFRSGLLLAGSAETRYKKFNSIETGTGSTEDGVLTAYEAMNINLEGTELVVLSACETGLGEVTNGEGVYGLQRAFKVAGAEAIIFSLWQVDDEATFKLMTTFYQSWLASGNKRDAFTKAQLAIREEYKLPHFWGAFVMIGG